MTFGRAVASLAVVGIALALLAATPLDPAAHAQQAAPLEYSTIFYANGPLKLQAYLYKPRGDGLFPLVIYNHGSRAGHDRDSMPYRSIGNLLLKSGFGVLVPERRGYGQSGGAMYYDEVGNDVGPRLIRRLEGETDDVLAALEYMKTLPWVDQSRLGIMGWSIGGTVSMMAAARSDRFSAVVDQAGGALTWPASPALQTALKNAADKITAPVLFMDAKNDRTTDAVTTLAKILTQKGTSNRLIVYDAFKPKDNPDKVAPGHLIFSMQGLSIWQDDVRTFFAKELRARD